MHTQVHGTLRVIATFITLMHTQLHGAIMSTIPHAVEVTPQYSVGSASPTCYESFVQSNICPIQHGEPQWAQPGAFHAVQGSIIGITLRQRPAAVILGQGQCKTLFIHAGLPLHLLLSLVKSLDKPEPDAILAKLNEVVSGTSCILTSWRGKKALTQF